MTLFHARLSNKAAIYLIITTVIFLAFLFLPMFTIAGLFSATPCTAVFKLGMAVFNASTSVLGSLGFNTFMEENGWIVYLLLAYLLTWYAIPIFIIIADVKLFVGHNIRGFDMFTKLSLIVDLLTLIVFFVLRMIFLNQISDIFADYGDALSVGQSVFTLGLGFYVILVAGIVGLLVPLFIYEDDSVFNTDHRANIPNGESTILTSPEYDMGGGAFGESSFEEEYNEKIPNFNPTNPMNTEIPGMPPQGPQGETPILTETETIQREFVEYGAPGQNPSNMGGGYNPQQTMSPEMNAPYPQQYPGSGMPNQPSAPSPAARINKASMTAPVVLQGLNNNEVFPINTLPAVIGASPIEATVQIMSNGIEPRHCELLFYDDALLVGDLGSTYGTKLNGELLSPDDYYEFRNGDVLRIGDMDFRVTVNPSSIGGQQPEANTGMDYSNYPPNGYAPQAPQPNAYPGTVGSYQTQPAQNQWQPNPGFPSPYPGNAGFESIAGQTPVQPVSSTLTPGANNGFTPMKLTSLTGFEDYLIEKSPFVIGTDPTKVDLILNRLGVSKRHLNIQKVENRFFVTDLNSTNGTRINGNPLTGGELYPLNIGDSVKIGDQEYRFDYA